MEFMNVDYFRPLIKASILGFVVLLVGCGHQLETGETGLTGETEILGTSKSTEARNHFSAGNKLLEEGKWEAAIERYTEAIKQDGSFGQAYENRALAYMRFNRFDKSLEDFAEALQATSDRSIWERFGNLQMMIDKYAALSEAASQLNQSEGLQAVLDLIQGVIDARAAAAG